MNEGTRTFSSVPKSRTVNIHTKHTFRFANYNVTVIMIEDKGKLDALYYLGMLVKRVGHGAKQQ